MYITAWTVVLAVLGAVPAALTQSRDVAWLWLLGVIGLACLDAALAPSLARVHVTRSVPGSVRLTETTASTVDIANGSGRTLRGAVRDAWPPSAGAGTNRHKITVGPRQSARVVTSLTPRRRGDRVGAHVTIRVQGPLRLAGRQRSVPSQTLLRVLPEFSSRKHLPARLARLRELDGSSPILLRGAGSEFDSLRPYVIGDDVRSIDWRATGRRADVIVRTYRPERDRRVFIVVDTSRLSAARVADAPRLEASIEAALLLAALASRAGDRVQVVAFDRAERARAAGSTQAIVMPALAEALAPIQPALVEPDWASLARLVNDRLSQRALVVLLTAVDAALIDSGALSVIGALQGLHQVLIASVDDPDEAAMLKDRDGAAALYGAGAAARTVLERDVVTARLRHTGAEVISAAPDDLAPRLADTYLALKASGRL